MVKITSIFFFSILIGISLFAQTAPVVSNVTFAQRADGSLKVDVYYDVYDADGDTLYVTLQSSSDNGTTWGLPVNSVTGDVGSNILSGTNKQIIWDFGREKPNFFSDQVKVKVTATDIKCNGLLVDYGGKAYNTVQIGSQCWLKENLDIGVMIQVTADPSDNGVIEKYCYDNNQTNCETYGGLYQWNEAMQYQTTSGVRGICPVGWHIPSYAEFQTLAIVVNNDANALKAVGQGSGSGSGTNTSGFSALLAGHRTDFGTFHRLGGIAGLWHSTEYSVIYARYLYLDEDFTSISLSYYGKKNGISVRCLKD